MNAFAQHFSALSAGEPFTSLDEMTPPAGGLVMGAPGSDLYNFTAAAYNGAQLNSGAKLGNIPNQGGNGRHNLRARRIKTGMQSLT